MIRRNWHAVVMLIPTTKINNEHIMIWQNRHAVVMLVPTTHVAHSLTSLIFFIDVRKRRASLVTRRIHKNLTSVTQSKLNNNNYPPLLCTSCGNSKICLPPMYNVIECSPEDQIPLKLLSLLTVQISIFRLVSLY
jgi:hypothetical protein